MLQEVILIRLLLVILLVVYHAFAPYCGAWACISVDYEWGGVAYLWIGKSAYSFMLESFVFISGYLQAYHVERKGVGILTSHNMLKKKVKRLIIPSVVFSIVYLLCFGAKDGESIVKMVYSVVEGRAHMWFLPMLFWCFAGLWIIEKIKINERLTLIILTVLSIVSFMPLPVRLGSAMYYMLFFYLGYVVKRHSDLINRFLNWKYIGIFGTIYLISFIAFTIIGNEITQFKIINMAWNNITRLIYSAAGVICCILIANYIVKVREIKLNDRFMTISTYCFGIYIAQQFILQALYYRTDFANWVGVGALPWVGVIITLLLSTCFAYFALKTKVGRFLIG